MYYSLEKNKKSKQNPKTVHKSKALHTKRLTLKKEQETKRKRGNGKFSVLSLVLFFGLFFFIFICLCNVGVFWLII